MAERSRFSSRVSSRPLLLATGVVAGLLAAFAIVWVAAPRVMLTVHESRFATVDETCRELKAAIEAEGWRSPLVRDMNKAITEGGRSLERQVRVVELCRADYAADVLATNPEVSTLMPCALGVYEGADGKVYVSGMNTGLMGKVFGGRIAEVMGNLVSADEARILARVVAR